MILKTGVCYTRQYFLDGLYFAKLAAVEQFPWILRASIFSVPLYSVTVTSASEWA